MLHKPSAANHAFTVGYQRVSCCRRQRPQSVLLTMCGLPGAQCRSNVRNHMCMDSRSTPCLHPDLVADSPKCRAELSALRQVAPGKYSDVPSTELYSFRSGAARLSSAAPAPAPSGSSSFAASPAQAPGSEPDGTVVIAAAVAAAAAVGEPSADGVLTPSRLGLALC